MVGRDFFTPGDFPEKKGYRIHMALPNNSHQDGTTPSRKQGVDAPAKRPYVRDKQVANNPLMSPFFLVGG